MADGFRPVGVARGIVIATNVVAGILVLWIVLYILSANPSNDLAQWVHHAADWLSTWSRDLFTPREGWLRTLLNYGIPAVVYLLIGHTLARRLR